ncbi:hypothetical protein Dsin_003267 [Dipteronia sinensis]|uniref:Uncharacterized protein n=1 Tax=Dipteronia sinensis TaxID=43782 RepID=A0AAE0B7C7_9ROSI|nr:hypothetical protein Dsin_003267 [Dipteronia sinensis]
MRCFICQHCSNPSFIFREEGTRKVAAEMGLKVVGEILLEMEIRKGCDDGVLVVVLAPESAVSKTYHERTINVVSTLDELARER